MGGYVVIYDIRYCDGTEGEYYYGYFSTPEEAKRLFRQFASTFTGDEVIHNAKLCQIAETLLPHKDQRRD